MIQRNMRIVHTAPFNLIYKVLTYGVLADVMLVFLDVNLYHFHSIMLTCIAEMPISFLDSNAILASTCTLEYTVGW